MKKYVLMLAFGSSTTDDFDVSTNAWTVGVLEDPTTKDLNDKIKEAFAQEINEKVEYYSDEYEDEEERNEEANRVRNNYYISFNFNDNEDFTKHADELYKTCAVGDLSYNEDDYYCENYTALVMRVE